VFQLLEIWFESLFRVAKLRLAEDAIFYSAISHWAVLPWVAKKGTHWVQEKKQHQGSQKSWVAFAKLM